MSEQIKKRLQFHLSTAVVLMFVAGGLLGLNLAEHNIPAAPIEQGRPNPCYFHFGKTHFYWDYRNLKLDAFTALAILFATAFLCEWLLRKEYKAERPPP